MVRVTSEAPGALVIVFHPRLPSPDSAAPLSEADLEQAHVTGPPAHTEAVLGALQRLIATHFAQAPRHGLELRVLPHGRLPPLRQTRATWHDTYRALCRYYTLPEDEAVAWDALHLWAEGGRLVLRAEARPPTTVLPLVHGLAYSAQFTALELVGVKVDRPLLHALALALGGSATLRLLRLRALTVPRELDLVPVFAAMRESRVLVLQELDVEGTELVQADLHALASYLTQANAPITVLRLTGADAGLKALLLPLANTERLRYLQRLGLRECRLEGAEDALQQLLLKRPLLDRLDLRGARLRLGKVFLPKHGLGEGLREVDLAGLRLDKDELAQTQLAQWVGSEGCALTSLNLTATLLPPEALAALLKALHPPMRLTLRAGANGYGREAGALLGTALRNGQGLVGLHLEDNPLGDEGLLPLALALATHRSLRELKLDRCARMSTAKARHDLVEALTLMARSAAPLEVLSLSARGHKDSRLKDALHPLLLALAPHPMLRDLNLEGQALGDEGARVLARLLAVTRSLRRLHLDDNGFTLTGLTEMAAALKLNQSLRSLPLPLLDLTRLLAEKGDDTVLSTVERLDSALYKHLTHDDA